MKWNIYQSERDFTVRLLGNTVLKKQRCANVVDGMIRHRIELTEDKSPMHPAQREAIMKETNWVELKSPTYFPESPELLAMLWRAKMSLQVEDLELDKFPRCFAIAWPDCEIDGIKPDGCLLWWGSDRDSIHSRIHFERKVLGKQTDISEFDMDRCNDQKFLHCFFFYKNEQMVRHVQLLKVSTATLGKVLNSEDEYNEWGNQTEIKYANFEEKWKDKGVDFIMPAGTSFRLDKRAFVVSRLAIRLMVYMRACENKVVDGYPEGKHARDFSTKWTGLTPMIVHHPAGFINGHGSPDVHWRDWHFRSYPRRKDGTKRNGVVYVSASVVGADIDPITVLE